MRLRMTPEVDIQSRAYPAMHLEGNVVEVLDEQTANISRLYELALQLNPDVETQNDLNLEENNNGALLRNALNYALYTDPEGREDVPNFQDREAPPAYPDVLWQQAVRTDVLLLNLNRVTPEAMYHYLAVVNENPNERWTGGLEYEPNRRILGSFLFHIARTIEDRVNDRDKRYWAATETFDERVARLRRAIEEDNTEKVDSTRAEIKRYLEEGLPRRVQWMLREGVEIDKSPKEMTLEERIVMVYREVNVPAHFARAEEFLRLGHPAPMYMMTMLYVASFKEALDTYAIGDEFDKLEIFESYKHVGALYFLDTIGEMFKPAIIDGAARLVAQKVLYKLDRSVWNPEGKELSFGVRLGMAGVGKGFIAKSLGKIFAVALPLLQKVTGDMADLRDYMLRAMVGIRTVVAGTGGPQNPSDEDTHGHYSVWLPLAPRFREFGKKGIYPNGLPGSNYLLDTVRHIVDNVTGLHLTIEGDIYPFNDVQTRDLRNLTDAILRETTRVGMPIPSKFEIPQYITRLSADENAIIMSNRLATVKAARALKARLASFKDKSDVQPKLIEYTVQETDTESAEELFDLEMSHYDTAVKQTLVEWVETIKDVTERTIAKLLIKDMYLCLEEGIGNRVKVEKTYRTDDKPSTHLTRSISLLGSIATFMEDIRNYPKIVIISNSIANGRTIVDTAIDVLTQLFPGDKGVTAIKRGRKKLVV